MTTKPDNPVLPTWFRAALIAVVTVSLCSCRAPVVGSQQASLDRIAGTWSSKPSKRLDPKVQAASDEQPLTGPTRGASVSEASAPPASHPALPVAPDSVVEPSPSDFPPPRVAMSCPVEGCDSGCPGGCDAGCPADGACGGCEYNGPGPRDEYLCDGADCGVPVGVRPDWTIDGLEQEDTIAHYDTLDGRVLIEPSNKVCIYAPRFGAVRRVVNASEGLQRELINVLEDDMALALADRDDRAATSLQQLPPVTKIGDNPASLLINRQQAGELEARVVVRELKNLIKPYCNLQVVKLGLVDNAEKPWLAKATIAAHTWTADQAAQVTIGAQAANVLVGSAAPGVMYADAQGEPCLRLIKLASAGDARPGEEIEFTLRFDNVGEQEIGNVTIVDNLTTRLSYVPDTAEASVEADFSTSNNGAGSLILRWEIKEPLKPGEGGVLQFRVKVR